MSRVEKWRRYREQIANMKFETYSSKKEASKQVEKYINIANTSQLDYNDIMEIRGIYGDSTNPEKRKREFHIRPDQIRYWSIAALVISILVVALVLVSLNLWR